MSYNKYIKLRQQRRNKMNFTGTKAMIKELMATIELTEHQENEYRIILAELTELEEMSK